MMRTVPQAGKRGESLILAWAPLAYAVLVAVLLAARQGVPLRLVYLAGAIAIGGALQARSPARYLRFVLWMWFLTPLVRRLADQYAAWQDPNIVLLTPYLVSGLGLIPLIERLLARGGAPRRPHPAGTAMLGLAAAGVAVGIPFGFAREAFPAALETLNYLTPLALAYYVIVHSQHLHEIEREVTKTFVLGACVAGAYGIYQFGNPPPWDVNWMLNSEMESIGRPEPFAVRVFGTMNGPGVLAAYLAVALALWLAKPRLIGIPAAAITAVALLLTQVRSSWLAFLVSAVLIVTRLKPSQQLRAAVLVSIAGLAMGLLLLTPEMSDLVDTRMSTMEHVDEDTSAMARMTGHELALEFIATNPLGVGIGQGDTTIEYYISMRDSVIVASLVQFGLLGSTAYFIALFLLGAHLLRYYRRAASPQGTALACAGIGILAICWLGAVTAGPVGMCLWLLGGLAVADRHQARLRAARVLATARARVAARPAPAQVPVGEPA